MWVDSVSAVLRVLAVGAAAYVAVIVVLRFSGKRTLAKLNAFDLVVTVALGSTLATILLSSDVSFLEGFVALALLAALQFLVAFLSSRISIVRAAITASPTLVFVDGQFREEAMARQRIGKEEIRQVVRASGSGDLTKIAAVIMETDGSMSVITADKAGDRSALAGLAE